MDCYIKQLRDNDCAFASLKMLMAYYSKNKDYLFLKQDLDRENYSLWDIIQIAKKYGIEIQGVKISDMRKRFTLDYQPFLALFKDSNNENGHLVFVRKIKKNKMLIFDPKKGKYWMKMARFYEKWSGIYLRVISYEPALYRTEDTKIVKKTGMIVGNIISALSSILLLIGFYFVKDDSYFIVPLIFVVGFVLCSILSNIFCKSSFKISKKFS